MGNLVMLNYSTGTRISICNIFLADLDYLNIVIICYKIRMPSEKCINNAVQVGYTQDAIFKTLYHTVKMEISKKFCTNFLSSTIQ